MAVKVVGRKFYGTNNQFTEYTSDSLVFDDSEKHQAMLLAEEMKSQGFTNAHTVTKLSEDEFWLCDPIRAERGLEVLTPE